MHRFESGDYEEIWMAGGNSAGKTWTAMFLGAWAAAFKIKPGESWDDVEKFRAADYNILCTGPEQKQAMELWEKIELLYKNSPFLKHKVKRVTTGTRRKTHPFIELKNGATIEAVGLHDRGKHVEGEAYDLILVNEPADVRHLKFVHEKVLGPRTWRRGGVIAGFGTPKGKNDYYLLWRRGRELDAQEMENPYYDEDVYSFYVDARDNKYADQGKIKKFLENKSEELVEERIRGHFLDAAQLAFPGEHIELNVDEDMPDVRFEPIKPSNFRTYMHGVDFGRKEDYTVCITADITEVPFTIVSFYMKGGGIGTWEEIMLDLKQIHDTYGGDMVVDSTASAGDMQVEWLRDLNISFFPYSFGGSPAKKVRLINNLQDFLAKGLFRMPYIPTMREELHSYPRDMDDKGMSTDTVMSLALLAIGIQMYGPSGVAEPLEK